jgi:hypothetical protein
MIRARRRFWSPLLSQKVIRLSIWGAVRDRHQPIASSKEAKLVHALGFEQCAPAYLTEIGALAEQIDTHRRYLSRVLDDPRVTIALFDNTQYIARRR